MLCVLCFWSCPPRCTIFLWNFQHKAVNTLVIHVKSVDVSNLIYPDSVYNQNCILRFRGSNRHIHPKTRLLLLLCRKFSGKVVHCFGRQKFLISPLARHSSWKVLSLKSLSVWLQWHARAREVKITIYCCEYYGKCYEEKYRLLIRNFLG